MTVNKKIPALANYDKERAFWDDTDLDNLAEGELTPEETTVAETPTVTISVRLARGDVARLRALAIKRSQGSTTLARSWILERLAGEESGEDDPRAIVERLRADVEQLASALDR